MQNKYSGQGKPLGKHCMQFFHIQYWPWNLNHVTGFKFLTLFYFGPDPGPIDLVYFANNFHELKLFFSSFVLVMPHKECPEKNV